MHQPRKKDIRVGLIGRLACSVLLLAAGVDVLSQDVEDTGGATFHDVFVYMTTTEGLLGPNEMGLQPIDPGFWDPFQIQTSIHGWRTKTGRNDVQRLRAGLQSALGPFHFESSTLDILAAVEANSDWVVWDSEVVDSIDVMHQPANRASLVETPVDYVLGVDAHYFMSPGLDQVRLVVHLRLAPRWGRVGRTQLLFKRQYEYLSPSVGQVLRPFHVGEKEALAAEIEEDYRRLSEEYSENAAAYEKEKSRALEKLARRETIPPDLAVLEAWPDRSLTRMVGAAQRHMKHMISLDLSLLRGPGPERRERVRFEWLDESGNVFTKSAYLVGTFEGNTIYRDRKRNMYSVP